MKSLIKYNLSAFFNEVNIVVSINFIDIVDGVEIANGMAIISLLLTDMVESVTCHSVLARALKSPAKA